MSQCKNHPHFDGDYRPQTECLTCWMMWLEDQDPGQLVTAADLHKIITLLMYEMRMTRIMSI